MKAGPLATLLLVGAALWSAGCGGSSDENAPTAPEERLYPWLKGPSREFLVANDANAVPTFGREASVSERDQASRVIGSYMRARAAKRFETECRYFSRRFVKALVAEDATVVSGGRVTTCPHALSYFGSAASGDFKNTLAGPIDSLRIGEGRGFALYHGRDGRDWSIAVNREGGRWLVSTAAPTALGQ